MLGFSENTRGVTYVGETREGSLWDNGGFLICKKILLPEDCFVMTIDGFVKGNASNVGDASACLMQDSGGKPSLLIATSYLSAYGGGVVVMIEGGGGSSNARWISAPIMTFLRAGTYWLGFITHADGANGGSQIASIDDGRDVTLNSSFAYPDGQRYTNNIGTRSYSVRASILRIASPINSPAP